MNSSPTVNIGGVLWCPRFPDDPEGPPEGLRPPPATVSTILPPLAVSSPGTGTGSRWGATNAGGRVVIVGVPQGSQVVQPHLKWPLIFPMGVSQKSHLSKKIIREFSAAEKYSGSPHNFTNDVLSNVVTDYSSLILTPTNFPCPSLSHADNPHLGTNIGMSLNHWWVDPLQQQRTLTSVVQKVPEKSRREERPFQISSDSHHFHL